MKLFVTGGHGFIGSRVVDRLVARGNSVKCLLREKSQTQRIDHLPFERHLGDIRDKPSLVSGMSGTEAVIHLAAVSSWTDMRSSALEDTIILGTKNLIEAAKEGGVRRVVLVSSSMAVNASTSPRVFDETAHFEWNDPRFRYPRAKVEADALALQIAGKELELVTVNPAEVYGPNDDALVTAGNLRDILKDWPALACQGGTAITHVDDVAEGMVLALEKGRPGERYILGGDNLKVIDLVRMTLDIAGQKKPVLALPNSLLKTVVFGLAKLGLPTPVVPEVLLYATLYWFMDSSKAKKELGYTSRPAREVLLPTIRWLYESGRIPAAQAPNLAASMKNAPSSPLSSSAQQGFSHPRSQTPDP